MCSISSNYSSATYIRSLLLPISECRITGMQLIYKYLFKMYYKSLIITFKSFGFKYCVDILVKINLDVVILLYFNKNENNFSN